MPTKKTSRTNSALKENLASLNTKSKQSKSISKKASTKIKITQSRKKDLFPYMGMYKMPYRFEPMPEIADRLNLAWFDEHHGEERMMNHIRKYKLKAHQYKCYVNYWWLKDQK